MVNKKNDIQNLKFSELYYPTEHMAVDEVSIRFKGKVVFLHYTPTIFDLKYEGCP
jgi:hypothetical protein